MGELHFKVHTSNRLEPLLAALGERIAADPLPPLQPETIIVPGQGMARWLQLQLAQRHGIAAALDLPFPGAFLQRLQGEGPDPFRDDVLLWRIFRLLGDRQRQQELGPAARYCSDDQDGHKRYQLAQRLARCFDDYQLYRDDLLLAWQRGEDAEPGPHAGWQQALWRALLQDADLPLAPAARPARKQNQGPVLPGLLPFAGDRAAPAPASPHRLERLRQLLADPVAARAALPPRLSVFGAVTLPPAFVRALHAIAAHVPVTLYVPVPTPHFFGDQRRRRGGSASDGNPLLQQFGAEAREFADLLLDLDSGTAAAPLEFPDPGTGTCLSTLQSDILQLQDRSTGGSAPPLPLRAGDESLRVHSCHSPLRELEVIRDQILHAFAQDRALQPHEVMVLVPDIDRYAPYAHAVFGPVQKHLPYQVADRSPASDLPLVSTFLRVLELARDRLAAFEVLHLLEQPALARSFGLGAADLPVLREWVQRAGIRWGIDGEWRARSFQVPAFEENSWRQGLRRLLMGYVAGSTEALVAGVLPAADATDGRSALLGSLVAFVDRLFGLLPQLARPHTLPVWADLLDSALQALLSPRDPDELQAAMLLRQAHALLREQADASALRDELSPAVLQAHLRHLLQRSAAARGFLGGAITIAALQPMRSLPCKLLCIAGLDDQSYPRRHTPPAFDLIAQRRRPGDRSQREDDRQLFLDALLAARQRLVLTYVGRSQKDDSECAASVVLDDLLGWLDAAFLPPAGQVSARRSLWLQQPLQAFSARYRDGADPRLFTYAGAEAAQQHTEATFATASTRAPVDLAGADVPLARLLEFWPNPARYYLKHVLDLRLPDRDEHDEDAEPFTLGGLDRWAMQDRGATASLRGETDPPDALARARGNGLLPPAELGAVAFAELTSGVQLFVERVRPHHATDRRLLVVRGDGFIVHGELDGLGQEQVLARIANRKAKDELRAWIRHVFLCAARLQGDDVPTTTRVIARDASFVYLPTIEAARYLADLVQGFRQGLHTPLPFFEHASRACAKALLKDRDPVRAHKAATREWLGQAGDGERMGPPPDGEDPWVRLCFRDRAPLAEPEFADWAGRIWHPALGLQNDAGGG